LNEKSKERLINNDKRIAKKRRFVGEKRQAKR